MGNHSNHLIHETSPYLLQHAHNPVDWFPWGDEALQKAREENKPVLVSIGYAACHWCHVMEKESFEDEATAKLMNAEFVNIKIDREERPDLDHIYMDAVQAMTGSGGWPLNVFLTPEGKPFFGGTYFPPSRAHNRPSWTEVLQNISQLFNERRNEVNAQAENLTAHLLQSNSIAWQKQDGDTIVSEKTLRETFENIIKQADKEWGGFGRAPKFPQSFTIQFLLRHAYVTADHEALDQAMLSLDKMIAGGIYDQVGGGFARYSTDTEWLAPHFEKMLYDNALLIAVLSEAYQFTKKDRYREVIVETMDFIIRELLHPGKAFYSALDADSEGEEGKFYVWDMAEVKQVLGENADIFCRYFDITPQGNWEGKNILRVNAPLEQFAETENISIDRLRQSIDRGRSMLLEARSKRVRPLLDDKVILGWNALMNTACAKAFMATGEDKYRDLAIANMQFLLKTFSLAGGNELCHTWKNNVAKYPAFLDDYAFLIQALIQLQEITADVSWLLKARDLTEFVIGHYSETDTGLFYYTKKDQRDVIIRKKEIYDGAVPSGNSVMAYNLYQLGIYFDRPDWKAQSRGMVANLGELISRYPTSFGVWACLMQELTVGTFEIAILGKSYERLQADVFKNYLPHRVIMASETGDDEFPILAAKTSAEKPVIYLCKEFVCQQPVDSIERFMSLIDRV